MLDRLAASRTASLIYSPAAALKRWARATRAMENRERLGCRPPTGGCDSLKLFIRRFASDRRSLQHLRARLDAMQRRCDARKRSRA
jgi:hypothetical protein